MSHQLTQQTYRFPDPVVGANKRYLMTQFSPNRITWKDDRTIEVTGASQSLLEWIADHGGVKV